MSGDIITGSEQESAVGTLIDRAFHLTLIKFNDRVASKKTGQAFAFYMRQRLEEMLPGADVTVEFRDYDPQTMYPRVRVNINIGGYDDHNE